MYQKVLTKPRKWAERSLALATKEELAADLLLRKAQLANRKKIIFPWELHARKQELYWIGLFFVGIGILIFILSVIKPIISFIITLIAAQILIAAQKK